RLIYFVLLIDRVFHTTMFPLVARSLAPGSVPGTSASEAGTGSGVLLMQRLARWVLLVVLPVAGFGLALARPIVVAVYGGQYSDAAVILAIIVWLVVTTTFGSLCALGLVALRRDQEYARNMAIGTLTVLVLSLALVIPLKARGVGIALVSGELVMCAAMFSSLQGYVRLRILPVVVRPAIGTCLVGAGLSCLVQGGVLATLLRRLGMMGWSAGQPAVLAIVLVLGLAIYAGFMYLVGGIDRDDLAFVRRQFGR
ncbi:MAG: oligosaccharide flippase family protein, partial [candidate division WOR-3 bacterium]